jgi:hypothetical protein
MACCGLCPFLIGGCPTGDGGGGNVNDNVDNDNDNDNGNDNVALKAFVGAATCQDCHGNRHEDWAATAHAEALEALKAIGQGANADCLPCHTVGFGETDGFVDEATTPGLAGVQCENCHGAGRDHVLAARADVTNPAVHPPVDISANVCGACHQDVHHPNFEQWSESAHSQINEAVEEDLLAGGTFVNNCGICHSGDVFVMSRVWGQTVPEDLFAGATAEDLNPVSCAVCHDPHARTGNAAAPDEGRDYQLRFPEVVAATQANTVAETSDPTRFNLCGQCHHDRGRTWQTTTRPPHHSVQSNFYFGEMPAPEGEEPLVRNTSSVHAGVSEQCASCHMFRRDFESEQAPAISGHSFAIDFEACAGCHNPAVDPAEGKLERLKTEVEEAIADILTRLDDPSTWQYSATGGPKEPDAEDLQPGEMTQDDVSDEIKKVRFLYSYVDGDGSDGAHNPYYVRAILAEADDLLTSIGR